ncbi:hypothetical protein [Actinoallomurus sp. NPDC052274]|uniref:hypothetical protein n=1 Tax=Actinoallomurus sp. NPDC052274 TaxID=3155420 RepID=UPI00341964C6
MRAAVLAVVCVVLSLVGHDLMTSRPAPAWAGWTAVAAVTAVGYHLADRRRSARWILLAVEAAQLCLHEWFAWTTPADPGSTPAHLAMTTHGGMHTAMGSGAAVSMNHGSGASGLGMAGAHALAGALVALWLYAGERAAWRVLAVLAEAVLGHALRVLLLLACVDRAASRRPAGVRRRWGADQTPPAMAVLRHFLVRRGPPRGSGAVLRAAR